MRTLFARALLTLVIISSGISGKATAQDQPPPADPLTAHVDTSAVERFVALWNRSGGHPSAAQIDDQYIRNGSPGVKGFVKERQISGANIAQAIAAHHDWYAQAIDKCLPWVRASNSDLRSIYLGLQGLLPEKPLPQIYMAIGRANTGGTAVPGAQLLGLETICHLFGSTEDSFRAALRMFFGHETAHTYQPPFDAGGIRANDPLLYDILSEGGADYVASLVIGSSPSAHREAFGRLNEAEIWKQFAKDRASAARSYDEHSPDAYMGGYSKAGWKLFHHWLYNGESAKLPGWEADMGYWLGMQIIKAYVEKSVDPHAAIREALALQDPAEILRKSGYASQFPTGARDHGARPATH